MNNIGYIVQYNHTSTVLSTTKATSSEGPIDFNKVQEDEMADQRSFENDPAVKMMRKQKSSNLIFLLNA